MLPRIKFVSGAVLPLFMLSACSSLGIMSPGNIWQSITNERDPQMVGGGKHSPNYNQPPYQSGMAPEVLEKINGSPHDLKLSDEELVDNSYEFKTYVPVESADKQSKPVILKYEQQQPEGEQQYQHAPMPNEPSIFDNITGWFNSGVNSNRPDTVVLTKVSGVQAMQTPIPENNPDYTPMSVANETEGYPPLASVPKTPARLKQVRMEGPDTVKALLEMRAATEELRQTLDAQRAAEAPDSLLGSEAISTSMAPEGAGLRAEDSSIAAAESLSNLAPAAGNAEAVQAEQAPENLAPQMLVGEVPDSPKLQAEIAPKPATAPQSFVPPAAPEKRLTRTTKVMPYVGETAYKPVSGNAAHIQYLPPSRY